MPRILAVIADYHDTQDAQALSLQLGALNIPDFSVRVLHVDNGNPTPVNASAEQTRLGVEIVRIPINRGFSGAINFGIKHAESQGERYDAYWIFSADIRIEDDNLSKLWKVLESRPKVAIAATTVRLGTDSERVWCARGVISPHWGLTAMEPWDRAGPLPKWSYLPTCSTLVRPEAYREVGGLPEHYRLYYEDTHFSFALQTKGWELWIEPTAFSHHLLNSMELGVPSRHYSYYFLRNNLRFWQDCFGIPWLLQFPRTLFVAFKEVILPLRRARTAGDLWDRVKYLVAGLYDGVLFAQKKKPYFEGRLAGLVVDLNYDVTNGRGGV